MENLLCNEVFDLTSPIATEKSPLMTVKTPLATVTSSFETFDYVDMHAKNYNNYDNENGGKHAKENLEDTFGMFVEKEKSYIPKKGFVNYVNSDEFVKNSRFKAICWLVKTQRRFNLSLETVFTAVNYFDRFIATYQCQAGWKAWVYELLSISCLHLASKFNEATPQLLELLEEGLETVFEPSMIKDMETTVLDTLEWRLRAVTPCAYIEMLFPKAHYLNRPSFYMNQLLQITLIDDKFLDYRPSVIALAAIKYMDDNLNINNKAGLEFYTNHKAEITECVEIMCRQFSQAKKSLDYHCNNYYETASPRPQTVLTEKEFQTQERKFYFRLLVHKNDTKEAIRSPVTKKRKIDCSNEDY